MRHLVLSPWFLLPWLAALGHPAAGPVVGAVLFARGPGALPSVPASTARTLVLLGLRQSLAGTGRYAVRPALQVIVAAAVLWPPARKVVPCWRLPPWWPSRAT